MAWTSNKLTLGIKIQNFNDYMHNNFVRVNSTRGHLRIYTLANMRVGTFYDLWEPCWFFCFKFLSYKRQLPNMFWFLKMFQEFGEKKERWRVGQRWAQKRDTCGMYRQKKSSRFHMSLVKAIYSWLTDEASLQFSSLRPVRRRCYPTSPSSYPPINYFLRF